MRILYIDDIIMIIHPWHIQSPRSSGLILHPSFAGRPSLGTFEFSVG